MLTPRETHHSDPGFTHFRGCFVALTRMRPIADVALATERPYRTIQTWARQRRIPVQRDGDRVLVDIVQAAKLSEQTGRRNRSTRTDTVEDQ